MCGDRIRYISAATINSFAQMGVTPLHCADRRHGARWHEPPLVGQLHARVDHEVPQLAGEVHGLRVAGHDAGRVAPDARAVAGALPLPAPALSRVTATSSRAAGDMPRSPSLRTWVRSAAVARERCADWYATPAFHATRKRRSRERALLLSQAGRAARWRFSETAIFRATARTHSKASRSLCARIETGSLGTVCRTANPHHMSRRNPWAHGADLLLRSVISVKRRAPLGPWPW